MWYTVKKADLRIFTFMHWFKHTILQFKIIYFCLYRCREYSKYISTIGLTLHCLVASMVMTWLEQGVPTFSTCCDHVACKTGQPGLCIDIYQYIYILYFVELSPFFPCLFLHICPRQKCFPGHTSVSGVGQEGQQGWGFSSTFLSCEERGNSTLCSSGP